jgi:hypothetical protein
MGPGRLDSKLGSYSIPGIDFSSCNPSYSFITSAHRSGEGVKWRVRGKLKSAWTASRLVPSPPLRPSPFKNFLTCLGNVFDH